MTSEWQPIETAPKDGTVVLGWCGPEDECRLMHFYGRRWECPSGAWDSYSPTHWMPLPPPPGDE